MREIKTYSPRSLEKALDILTEQAAGVKVIAGGTDLVVQVLERKKDPRSLLDISRLEELSYIREDGDRIRIGALTTQREVEKSPLVTAHAPLLCEGIRLVGSPQLRNTCTLGGNIINASPVADTVPPLMALDTELTLRSVYNERRVPLRGFFNGPGDCGIEPYELLVEISFAKLGPGHVSFYERLGQRKFLSIAKVGVAFKAVREGAGLSDVAVVHRQRQNVFPRMQIQRRKQTQCDFLGAYNEYS